MLKEAIETVWSKPRSPGLMRDPELITRRRVTHDEVRSVGSLDRLLLIRRMAIDATFRNREGLREHVSGLPPRRLIRSRDGETHATRPRGRDRKQLKMFRDHLKVLHHNRLLLNKEIRLRRAKFQASQAVARAERKAKAEALGKVPQRRSAPETQRKRREATLLKIARARGLKAQYVATMHAAQRERERVNKDPILYERLLHLIAQLRPRVKGAREGAATKVATAYAPGKLAALRWRTGI